VSQSTSCTTVLHVGGLHWAASTASVETTLLRRPGVASVAANAGATGVSLIRGLFAEIHYGAGET
jgi:hypothetical protein